MIRVRPLLVLLLAAIPLAVGCGDDSTPPTKPQPPAPPSPAGLQPGVLVGTGTLTGEVYALAVGDLNGDSLADVAVAGENRQVWVGLGSPTGLGSGTAVDARVQANALAIADLDHDGISDLIVAGRGAVTLLKGSAGGISAAAETLATLADTLRVGRMRAGDLTNDGYAEAVLTTYWRDGTLGFPHYQGWVVTLSGTTSLGSLPGPAELGDVNGDGSLDIVLNGFNFISSSLQVRLGAGNGTFGPGGAVRAASGIVSRLLLSDLNGDGADEAVLEYSSNGPGIGVMAWNGASLGTESAVPGAPHGQSCVAADLNGDGRPDLAMSAYLDPNVWLLYGNGTRSYTVGTAIQAGDGVAEIGAGDVDGNGLVDLITRGTGAGTVRFLNNAHQIEVNAMR